MQEATLNHLPIIDWELGKKLAGNSIQLAQDILQMLTDSLSDNIATINQLHIKKNYPELQKEIHKLHGAVAYSGTPRLKKLLAHLETQLKKNVFNDLPLDLLNEEVVKLLKESKKFA